MTTTRTRLILLIAIATVAISGTSHAQTVIGSGGGWQTWSATAKDQYGDPLNLNNSGAPYWDVTWGASGAYGGGPAEKNVGFCLTSTGDCQGPGSALFAPGAIPFWGMHYDSATDTGGARDNKVYFHNTAGVLVATLFLNASAITREVNDFGWFETNVNGTYNGPKHKLFSGTGDNQGTLTPDKIGKTVLFTPTTYFGYYYSDVSEPADPVLPTDPPVHGCYAYTIFAFTEPRCLDATGFQGDHDFVVFTTNPASNRAAMWIAGEDPTDCLNKDGDCNLTLVRVAPLIP